MSEYALPCIACGAELRNVGWNQAVGGSDSENQPSDGTAFWSTGHYGSTFFDPMDGSQIEITVCDECLRKHTERVLWRQAAIYLTCCNVQVGREWLPDRQYVPYNPELPPAHECREIEPEDFGKPWKNVEWAYDRFELAQHEWEREPE
jgi:hypothetical protein